MGAKKSASPRSSALYYSNQQSFNGSDGLSESTITTSPCTVALSPGSYPGMPVKVGEGLGSVIILSRLIVDGNF